MLACPDLRRRADDGPPLNGRKDDHLCLLHPASEAAEAPGDTPELDDAQALHRRIAAKGPG